MLKVLVVEDEELIRKGIVLAVDWAALDCVVVGEASNGEEALDAVERLSPSLIITDLKMPRMDGIEMLRRLREAGNPVYVIILTAYDSFSYRQLRQSGTQCPHQTALPVHWSEVFPASGGWLDCWESPSRRRYGCPLYRC